MELALQQLVLMIGALMLGVWLYQEWGWPQWIVIVMPILGAVAGIGIMYKQSLYKMKQWNRDHPDGVEQKPLPEEPEEDDWESKDPGENTGEVERDKPGGPPPSIPPGFPPLD